MLFFNPNYGKSIW